MGDDPIIRGDNVGKRYTLSRRHDGRAPAHMTLREVLAQQARGLGLRLRGRERPVVENTQEEFWALRDVSFEVKRSEVLGIIGRNGAGKSTLLKILSRITEPTTGRIELDGRVASLLEVGTGFHPELTGRENVYLNGSILGMTRTEIRRKFDEIVAFSEVEKFLETPVKRYSSGMYMRLAFAVAAHLEPDILIIDEVLAVGDSTFQEKCLGKMREVSRGGRTVLFVSHNMVAVRHLCSRVCVLQHGRLAFSGPTDQGLSHYLAQHNDRSARWQREEPTTNRQLVIQTMAVELSGKQPHQRLDVELRLSGQGVYRPAFVALDIADDFGTVIMQALPRCTGFLPSGRHSHLVRVQVDLPPLVPGQYLVTPWVGPYNTETYDTIEAAVCFAVEQSPTPDRTFPHTRDHGCIVPPSTVQFESH